MISSIVRSKRSRDTFLKSCDPAFSCFAYLFCELFFSFFFFYFVVFTMDEKILFFAREKLV